MLDQMKDALINQRTEDIILSGFVDIEDGFAQFHPDMRTVYLLVGDQYVEFESIEQFSKLKVTFVDGVKHRNEIDQDMIPAQSSMAETLLVDVLVDNSITKIQIYDFQNEIVGGIVCNAMLITLGSGQMFFFDPTFHYGIGVGGIEQLDNWKINNPDFITRDVLVLN